VETERELLHKELKLTNKELEQMLYVTSHDLRSPLVNVEGYSREIEYSLKDLMSSIDHADIPSSIEDKITPILKEDIPESLYYIRTSVSKMNTLLSGILTLSRVGRSSLTIEDIDMNEMMSDIVDSHRFRLNEQKIKTDKSSLPNCKGDSSQINQVFSNLLDNAVKYTDPERHGVIHISGYKDKDQSVYCIEDNGIGISPEHQDKIFEIFHQLEPNRFKGEGMGLTIAHRIIERHNGKIWVVSELGKGSKFFVSLPS
jgi:signal transduction histidine kinase